MKNILNQILFLMCITIISFSCQKEDEYTLKKYNPKGGFPQEDFTIESGKYLKKTTEDVEVALNFNRLENKGIELSVKIDKIEPAKYASLFSLASSSISISGKNDTIKIGKVNWAKLLPDSSAYVTLKIMESETIETGANTESLTIKFHKEAVPVIDFGNKTMDMYFNTGSSDDINTTVEIEVLDKPAEEAISIPLQSTFQLTEGTQFDIEQTLNIPIGSKSATFDLSVYNSAFGINERGAVWLEIYEDDVPENLSVNLADNYWFGYNLGKTAEIIKLYAGVAYDAKINPAFDKDPTKSFELEVKVSDFPVLKDLEIPVKLNQVYAKEGTHFLMTEKVIKIEAGDTTGIIKFNLLPENFNLGDTIPLYVELDTDFDAGSNVNFDGTDFWTTVNLIKLDAFVATLSTSASYDALISDVTTNVDVDVTIPGLLDKAAPSDIEIPVSFNESYAQAGTHFNSDGIIRVNTGETSGTITITVIGSAFSAGESNELYIEIHDEDMPETPVIVRNPDNWWTTLNVGKN